MSLLCQNRFHHWLLFVVTTLCLRCNVVVSWVAVTPPNTPNTFTKFHRGLKLPRYMSSSSSPIVGTSIDTNNNNDNSAMENMNKNTTTNGDNDDDDWEYIEFDSLTESDLVGSEWLVGTCWDNRPDVIDETWCRLGRGNEKDQNIAIWGDNSQGTWALDVATQYLTISKVQPWGKQIWACLVEDYYYLRGTVRGWTYWTAASVEAQWQARRLNVDPDEAGIAPWFDDPSDEKEEA
jgi:hypothetical protein